MTDKQLARRAGRGVLWQMGGGVWLTVIRLGASTILARALQPTDFGLFGMALLARELIVVAGNIGMSTGLIAKKEVTEEDLSTAFWTMAAARVLMFFAAFAFAPLAALFFRDPRVTDVLRVVSVTFLLAPLSDVGRAILRNELRFKALVLLQAVGAIVESVAAVVLAVTTTWGYWCLVAGMMAGSLIVNVGVVVVSRWRPKFVWNHESFEYLFRFGVHGLGFGVFNYINQNIDYLLVGRILGASSLGLYEFAYRIPHLVLDRIARPVGAVVFPALSKLQGDDERLIAAYVKAVTLTSLVAFPALVGLAAVADVAVHVLWGNRWVTIVTPLRILAISAAFRTVVQPVGAIFYCKDRPDLPFKFTVLMTGFTFIVVAILGAMYGVVGVACGMTLSLAPSYYVLRSAFGLAGTGLSRLATALSPVVVSSAIMGIAVYSTVASLLSIGLPEVLVLVIAVALGAVVYPVTVMIVFTQFYHDVIASARAVFGKA